MNYKICTLKDILNHFNISVDLPGDLLNLEYGKSFIDEGTLEVNTNDLIIISIPSYSGGKSIIRIQPNKDEPTLSEEDYDKNGNRERGGMEYIIQEIGMAIVRYD